MPRIGPIQRKDFIFFLRRMGFDGPYVGGKHQIMRKGMQTIRVPIRTGET
jgi:predicted RNA binding protein YcfA (HicA-like mRNA interferase family)